MPDYINTEQMERAANTFDNAVDQLRRVVGQFDNAVCSLNRILEPLDRLIMELEKFNAANEPKHDYVLRSRITQDSSGCEFQLWDGDTLVREWFVLYGCANPEWQQQEKADRQQMEKDLNELGLNSETVAKELL